MDSLWNDPDVHFGMIVGAAGALLAVFLIYSLIDWLTNE